MSETWNIFRLYNGKTGNILEKNKSVGEKKSAYFESLLKLSKVILCNAFSFPPLPLFIFFTVKQPSSNL